MKLALLLLTLNSPPNADHLMRMRTAELHFEEHEARVVPANVKKT